MNTEIEKLTQILRDSNNIVFFGGAGVSTETQYKIHKNRLYIKQLMYSLFTLLNNLIISFKK